MASELYNVIDALSREKGIDPEIVVAAVEDAIVVATRKFYKTQESLRAVLDRETGADPRLRRSRRSFPAKTRSRTPRPRSRWKRRGASARTR